MSSGVLTSSANDVGSMVVGVVGVFPFRGTPPPILQFFVDSITLL
jgi:hypothetical protein